MVLSADKIVCGAVGRAGCEPGPSAPGWSGVVADVDRTLSTKAMDDATPAWRAYVFYPLSCGQGSYRAEQRTLLPGRSRGGKRGVQERVAFVPVLYVS